MIYRNRLLQRVSRHANMAMLFPTASEVGQTAVSPTPVMPSRSVSVTPLPAVTVQQEAAPPQAGEATPPILEPVPQPVVPTKPPATPVERWQSNEINPDLLPAQPLVPAESTTASEEEDPAWTRLQNIMRLHEGQVAPVQTAVSEPTVQKTAEQPSAAAPLAATVPLAPSTQPTSPPAATPLVEPTPANDGSQSEPAVETTADPPPIQRQSTMPPQVAKRDVTLPTTTVPTEAVGRMTDAPQQKPAVAARRAELTESSEQPASQTPVSEPVVEQNAPAIIQRQVNEPSSVEQQPHVQHAVDKGEVAKSSQIAADKTAVSPPAAVQRQPQVAEHRGQAVPLEQVWPVAQTDSVAQPKAKSPSQQATSNESVAPAASVPLVPAPSPQVVQRLTEDKTLVQERLATVEAERPTESAIDLILPRRPHPAQLPQLKKTAVSDLTPPSSQRQHAETTMLQRDAEPSSGAVPATEQVTEPPLPPALPSAGPPIFPPAAKAKDEAVLTSIGELPGDLWDVLGEERPEQPPAAETDESAAAPPTVQRTPIEPETVPQAPRQDDSHSEATMPTAVPIQREVVQDEALEEAIEETADSEAEDASESDDFNLDDIAQRVFRQLRRKLTVEYERMRRQR